MPVEQNFYTKKKTTIHKKNECYDAIQFPGPIVAAQANPEAQAMMISEKFIAERQVLQV